MRSKIFKKIMAVVCASAVLATSIASPVKTDAASKKAKKAYEKVVKKLNSNKAKWESYTYQYYDFNKDGLDELVVCLAGGARAMYSVYTYKNGKVVDTGAADNDIGYLKGKKYIVGYGSGGASNQVKLDRLINILVMILNIHIMVRKLMKVFITNLKKR